MHVSASYRGRVRHHDLLVIGSGSGNSIVDHRFADLDVAMVEHGTFGGTCINVGCVPTKMYVYPADIAHSLASGFQAHLSKPVQLETLVATIAMLASRGDGLE